MKCEGQKPFKITKKDKLILIIDGSRDDKVTHELIRIDFKEQLKYLSKFLENFISNKEKIRTIISGCKYDMKADYNHNKDAFSSWRVKDRLSNIDFFQYSEKGKLFLFMAVNYKKKPKKWWAEDYFSNF